MIIIHINGAKYIFPLFCDNEDTESDSCEIINSISQPLLTKKNIKDLNNNAIYTLQD